MVGIKWTPQAEEDLESIARFIAKSSPQYARIFVIDIFKAADQLSRFPESGRIVPEINNSTVRELILGNYRLVYRFKRSLIEILTLYHGAIQPRIIKGTYLS